MVYGLPAIKDVKKIALLGGGRSNLALVEIFKRLYPSARTVLRDESVGRTPAGFDEVYLGKTAFSDISEDVLLLSPSVRRDRDAVADAIKRGAFVTSDAEYFFAVNKKPVFAVSGSDGKSTVTYMTAALMRDFGFSEPSGNFGVPLCTLSREELCGTVAELSSFQLSYLAPTVERATVTNVSENHLNWHKDFEEYISAKENCIKNALFRVLPLWCDICRERFIPSYKSTVILAFERTECELLRLGAEHTVIKRGDKIYLDGSELLSTRGMKRREEYTVKNLMTAIGMTIGYATPDRIRKFAADFGGLEHRCELVACRDGVEFINSSIDTTPTRSAATISALGVGSVVILTGLGKGLSYEPLNLALNKYAEAVVICGENADKILNAVSGIGVPTYIKSSFDEAVLFAAEIAHGAKRVLLSPAHTSFDAFSSFEERGNRFKTIINEYVNTKI